MVFLTSSALLFPKSKNLVLSSSSAVFSFSLLRVSDMASVCCFRWLASRSLYAHNHWNRNLRFKRLLMRFLMLVYADIATMNRIISSHVLASLFHGLFELLQTLLGLLRVLYQWEILFFQFTEQVQQLLRICEVQLWILLQGTQWQTSTSRWAVQDKKLQTCNFLIWICLTLINFGSDLTQQTSR